MKNLFKEPSSHIGMEGSRLFTLTHQEWKVLMLLADDQRNAEIAETLFLATKSVEGYVTRIGTKLGLKGRESLARSARKNKNDLNRFYQVHVVEN